MTKKTPIKLNIDGLGEAIADILDTASSYTRNQSLPTKLLLLAALDYLNSPMSKMEEPND